MSLSSGIDQKNPDPNLGGKFYPNLIPWEADPRGDMTLGAVLVNGNSALTPIGAIPQNATDFDTIGCLKIETGVVGQGNNLALQVGEAGDNLQIKGGTNLGSILVGNGLNTEELVCPTTTTTATTGTIYNWLSLANGQSRDFFVSDGTLYQLGYSITIVYSGTDSITGTITAIVGNLITITIASFTSAVYTPATLITTTSPDPTTATSGGGDPVFIFNPAVCTPATIPNNSFLLTGLCYLYGAPPVVGSSNISLTAQASPPAINGTTSIFSIPQYENPPVSTSAFSWGTAGCFIPDGTSVTLASNAGGAPLAFAFPTGGSFIDQDFTGSVSGYTLAYTPNGVITINSKLVLTADNTKPLGVFWGVDAQGVGTVTSVSAGTNISISGSLSAPVVNFATPTTSTITLGASMDIALQQVVGASGAESMDLTAGHLNFLNSTTGDNSSYVPTQIGFTDLGGTVFSSLTNIGLNFTDNGNGAVATLGADAGLVIKPTPLSADGTELTYTKLEIIKDDPVALTIETSTANKDGFTTITEQTPAGSGEKGASSIVSNTTQGEVSVLYENQTGGAPGIYQGTGSIISTASASTMTLTSSNIAGASSQLLRMECPLGGDALIEHTFLGATPRNLDITTQGQFAVLAGASYGWKIETPPGGFSAKIEGSPSGQIIEAGSYFNFSSNRVGSINNPSYTFDNNNSTASGFPAIKIDRSLGNFVAGDTIGTISMWGKDGAGTSREWSRIQTKTENVGAVNQDGTLSIFNSVNGSVVETFNFNGGQNENNSFRPLDMNNNAVRTTTGDLTLNATASTGTGHIILQPKLAGEVQIAGVISQLTNPAGQLNISANTNMSISANNITETSTTSHTIATPSLVFTGALLQSASSGGNSGQHLVITLNGTQYKIALQNP
jgi:hypothetical protein